MKFSILAWLADWRKQRSLKRPIRPVRPPLTLEYLEDRLAPAIITVNTNADNNVRDNQISLREAIDLADGTLLYGDLKPKEKSQVDLGNGGNGPTPDKAPSNTIQFNLPAGQTVITISKIMGELPAVTRPVIIEGGEKVTIDGGSSTDENSGISTGILLSTSANGSRIYGLTIQGFYKYGIQIQSKDNRIGGTGVGGHNVIQKNGANVFIDRSSGNTLVGNSILDAVDSKNQQATGVLISGGFNNTIGKAADAADSDKGVIAHAANVISGNPKAGVIITNSNSNTVIGNFIGLQANGKTNYPNAQQFGVTITGNSSKNRIGGMAAGDRNTISGNAIYGIQVDGAGATDNQIEGNNIGTMNDGTQGNVGNKTGIAFTNGANANTVKMNQIKYITSACKILTYPGWQHIGLMDAGNNS